MSFVGMFFLAVLVVGTTDFFLLVWAAGHMGVLSTLALCIITGMVGGSLVRHQGLRTLQEIQQGMARGQVPAVEIVGGLVLLVVGVMLILPGFFTDVVGFLLLIPLLRRVAASLLVARFRHRVTLVHPFDSANMGGMGGMGDLGGFGPMEPPGGDPGHPGKPGPRVRPKGRVIDVDPEG